MNVPTSPTRGKRNHPSNWTKHPERAETHCFYCHEPLGEDTHKPDCVVVTRTVVLEMKIQYVVEVPRDWDEEMIRFHRNDSSFCSNNDVRTINKQLDEHEHTCVCFRSETRFVREATEEDHESMAFSPDTDD
jgi:hypothetical protein